MSSRHNAMRFDAAVIGSGPAGATAARLLARAGWSVALIERVAFPRRKVCGEFVSAATLPALHACGIGEDFLARAGPPVREVAAFSGEMTIAAPMPRVEAGWGRALGREQLDVLLRDAAVAAGATLLQPAEVIALDRHTDGHVLRLRLGDGADTIVAGVVIAACGSWHTRGLFAIRPESRPSDLFAFKAHLRGGALAPGMMPLLAFPGGYGGLVHGDGGRITLSCCIRRDMLARARSFHGAKAGEAVFRHILASTAGVRHALQDTTIEGAILATGPIRPGIRARYRDGIFFVGNAAGEAHPIIAEGISMAIQSSWLLAQRLLSEGPAGGFDYARAWNRQFAPRVHAASVFAWLAMNDHSRAAMAQLLGAFPTLLSWGARLSGKAEVRHVAA
jgi:flavin-dependent dehydrogenase